MGIEEKISKEAIGLLMDRMDKYVRDYGFLLHHTTNSLFDRTYVNMTLNIDCSFALHVDVLENKFEFVYHIPHTVFTIKSGWLSPFYEKQPQYNQFDKMFKKFKDVIKRY